MDIFDVLSALKVRATEQLPLLGSKRKRENALLLPFFAALGYNPFDVRDVEPEYTIEVDEGGETTVDYALKTGSSPAILFHLEKTGTDLDVSGPGGLLRALRQSGARVGVRTNGLQYRFYADLEPFYAALKGEMPAGEEPFMTFNLLGCSEEDAQQLLPLTKRRFRADEILSRAHQLKYTRLFRTYLQGQREGPDPAFVQFLMEQVHGGASPKGDVGMYTSPARDALRQLMEGEDATRRKGAVEGEGRGEGPAPVREQAKEEKQEGGARRGKAMQSEKDPDEEAGDSESGGEPSTDLSFREYFRKRFGSTD